MVKSTAEITQYDQLIKQFEKVIAQPIITKSAVYYTGVDLGTACIVLCVLDENYEPVAGAYRYADVVRDGMIVDYIGAVNIVRELKHQLEEELDAELYYAAAAIPPGTDALDSGAIKNVVQSAGFELTALLDEPTAANEVLGIKNGAVVDIGGGTTGISILKNGEVIKVDDEATGGTHFSLVVAGAKKVSFQEAELFKRDEANHQLLVTTLKPVIEKIGSIINQQIAGYDVEQVYLVGGSACFTGIETIIEKIINVPTFKPSNPMFVTPLGIAKSCTTTILE
ncbi:ethanolamine utilization protein EutJ [Vagococcus penaei]|uniref:Chaperone protein DnaK n=1 Tax=Vagococcus penaei TaxID=633807 RepID=A0A1Q2D617_9ENTE|nr:ethanolamine utilization protein EutJ [Vagococcus penaei]AQP53761.1 ethanolamine utilization protein EutJ [Vagococcus penaei]RSU00408.1 ethanolamine utilization protein EutJ [Vagococcus penaei]